MSPWITAALALIVGFCWGVAYADRRAAKQAARTEAMRVRFEQEQAAQTAAAEVDALDALYAAPSYGDD